jgi:[ribosomal protein S5]-alanine N-acetyltransferase
VILETERLRVRRLAAEDAPFVLRLLNEPSFLANIGDRGVRTLDDASRYIEEGPAASHARHGFGLDLVELRETGAAIGMCGLLRRDHLEHPDLGYALLPEHWSRGYAAEVAAGVLAHARDSLGIRWVLAVTSLDNRASIRVLERLGFEFRELVDWPVDGSRVRLFARDLDPAGAERPSLGPAVQHG